MRRPSWMMWAIFLFLATGVGFAGWWWLNIAIPQLDVEPTPEPLALAQFADHRDISPDASASSRLVRGLLTDMSPDDGKLIVHQESMFG